MWIGDIQMLVQRQDSFVMFRRTTAPLLRRPISYADLMAKRVLILCIALQVRTEIRHVSYHDTLRLFESLRICTSKNMPAGGGIYRGQCIASWSAHEGRYSWF